MRWKRWWKWLESPAVDRPAVLDPLEHHEAGVEERHGEHHQRADERDQGVGLERALDDHRAEQQPEQVRAAVAHEDRRRVEVVDAGSRARRRRMIAASTPARAAPEVEGDDRERGRRDRAHAGGEPVDAVGEVDDVHQQHEREHRQRPAELAQLDAVQERERERVHDARRT